MHTEKNARRGCHGNFADPRGPISSILGTWTNMFSRKTFGGLEKGDVIKPSEKCQVSQLLQTVSAEHRCCQTRFCKTQFSVETMCVRKKRFWRHFGHFHGGGTLFFETIIKPQRECEKSIWGRIILNFNWEFKKTTYFERRGKTRWNEVQTSR